MTDVELIARKLSVLQEHVARLRRRRGAPADAAPDGVDAQDAVSMSLLVATQQAIDLAFHLAADEGWGLPATHRQAFDILAAHGVIDAALAAPLAGSAQLRNRIAHGYATVDFARLWADLPAGLAALDAFATAVAAFASGAS